MTIDALKTTRGNMVEAAKTLHITALKLAYKEGTYRIDYRIHP